jgi:hypothetical protein
MVKRPDATVLFVCPDWVEMALIVVVLEIVNGPGVPLVQVPAVAVGVEPFVVPQAIEPAWGITLTVCVRVKVPGAGENVGASRGGMPVWKLLRESELETP